MMVCAGFQLLESQFGGLLGGCNFKFQPCGIYFYYSSSIGSCQIGYLRIMSRTVSLLGQPTGPDGRHALQRFRCKNSLTFSRPTPAESAVKQCALAYRSSDCVTYPIDRKTVARNTALYILNSYFQQRAAHTVLLPGIWSLNDDALPSVQSSVHGRI